MFTPGRVVLVLETRLFDRDIAVSQCLWQAKTMGKGAFITTFSSESVEAAAKEDPKQFTVAKEEWVLATEEMFTLILAGSSAKDS